MFPVAPNGGGIASPKPVWSYPELKPFFSVKSLAKLDEEDLRAPRVK